MSERNLEIVREYHFDPKEVIKGLNGYYESDKRNSYITIRRYDVESPAYLSTLYLSALIEWLREDFDIFYRPGLTPDQIEAARSAAKMCGLRAHIKDELSKRDLWFDKNADIPELVDTLFETYDGCVERADKNRKDASKLSEEISCVVKEKESAIKKLKGRIAELESNFKAVCDEDDIFRTRALKAEEEVRKLKEQLDKAAADYQALSEENQKHKDSVFDLEKTCYRGSYISDRIHEICTAKGVELDDAFLYNDDYTWEDLVGFLCEEIRKLKKEAEGAHKEIVCKDIMNYIRQEASRNGFILPEEIDGEPLTIKRVFHDLLELLRMKETRIRNAERETRKAVNDQLKKDTDYTADALCDILEALGISKSNTVHLDIPGLKTKAIQRASAIKSEHDRYIEQLDKAAADYQALSEENQKLKYSVFDMESMFKGVLIDAAVEKKIIDSAAAEAFRNLIFNDVVRVICQECYDRGLAMNSYNAEKFSYIQRTNKAEEEVKKLKEQKDRASIILQDLYRDIFHKDCTQFTYEDIANKILDRMLETEDLLHKSVDSVNKECKATGRLMVDNYKLKLKDYILKDIKKHGYRYDGLDKKSIEEIVDRIIEMATCPRNEWAKDEIENLRGQISRLKDLINAMNEEVKDM